jgi:hypothetical protein
MLLRRLGEAETAAEAAFLRVRAWVVQKGLETRKYSEYALDPFE